MCTNLPGLELNSWRCFGKVGPNGKLRSAGQSLTKGLTASQRGLGVGSSVLVPGEEQHTGDRPLKVPP